MHREKPDVPSLESLQEKIRAVKKAEGTNDAPGASPLGHAMHIAIDLVTGTAVGATIGYLLDRWLGTLPVCMLLGFCIGVAAGVKLMVRTLHEMDIHLDKNSDAPND